MNRRFGPAGRASWPLLVILAAAAAWTPASAHAGGDEAPPRIESTGAIYSYHKGDEPEVFFFPKEKARWDGSKVTMKEWYMLTDTQKERFITEYIGQLKKDGGLNIETIWLDYLRALNVFSLYSNDRATNEPSTKFIDRMLAGQGEAPPARSIVIESGQDFTITLGSNRTTGYTWELAGACNDNIVKFIGAEYVPDDTGMIGSGGREIWTFRSIGAGRCSITMVYVRPWEKDVRPAEKAVFTVRVTDAAGADDNDKED